MNVICLIEYDQPNAAAYGCRFRCGSGNLPDHTRSPLIARIEFDQFPVKVMRERMCCRCFTDAWFAVQDCCPLIRYSLLPLASPCTEVAHWFIVAHNRRERRRSVLLRPLDIHI